MVGWSQTHNWVSNQFVSVALKDYYLRSASIWYKPAPTVLSFPPVGVDMVAGYALGNWTCDWLHAILPMIWEWFLPLDNGNII